MLKLFSSDLAAARVPILMRVVLIAFLAGIYLFNVFELRQWMEAEIPTGPDQQCYHRQAQLFAESGIIGGLDTAVTFEGASYLISKAKAFGLLATPEPGWIAAVAPECHRYKSATGKIISQYPPGTGFLLSLFPDGRRVRLLYIVIETIILGWFAYLLWFARNIAASLLVCALGCFAVIQLNYEGYMSFSLAPSMLLCLLLAFCTVKMLTCETRRKQALFAAICGGLIGVSVSMRTANILLAGGYAFAFADIYLRKGQRKIWLAAISFAVALFIALVPSLAANAINAGSPFATTYSETDASRPVFTWDQIVAALDYHLLGEGIGYVFDAGLATTILFEIGRSLLRLKTIPYLSFINTATWAIAGAYYLTHSVLNSYYLIPTALFSMALIVFGLCESAPAKLSLKGDKTRFSPGTAGGIISACCVVTIVGWALILREGPKADGPLPSLEKNAIIWADPSGGLFSYYLKQHTATLDRAPIELQNRMIATIKEDRRPQYLIADSDLMRALIERTAGAVRVQNMFGYETYRLNPP